MKQSVIPAVRRDGTLCTCMPINGTVRTSDGMVLQFDEPPTGCRSIAFGDGDHDGTEDFFAAQPDGSIWFWAGSGDGRTFTLVSRGWGGTHPGFASGLSICMTDWNGDGALDAVCGTADGRLLLLLSTRRGRSFETDLIAAGGPSSVALSWTPPADSGVRGYRVYRSEGRDEAPMCLTETPIPLPVFRDYPATVQDYWYRISAVSRHFAPGSTEPIEEESDLSEPVRVAFGDIDLRVLDRTGTLGGIVEVPVAVGNAQDLSGRGASFTVTYDPRHLRPLKVLPTSLGEQIGPFADMVAGEDEGTWTISSRGGSGWCAPGSGTLFDLRFEAVALSAVTTTVTVSGVSLKSAAGIELGVATPVSGRVALEALPSSGALPAFAPGDLDGDGDVDMEDLRLLGKLKGVSGRRCTAVQLRSGDFNGNGKLDDADYQTLRARLVGGL